jgi:hypothetical protein
MLERFYILRDIINGILLKFPRAPPMTSGYDRNVLLEVLQLLRSLEKNTVEMSGDSYVSSSKVIPIDRILRNRLETSGPNSDIVGQVKSF